MWSERTFRDRAIATILFVGGLGVGLSLLIGDHGLRRLPIVTNVIFPGGCAIVAFWLAASLAFLSERVRVAGWWISAAWHLGWLAYLLATVFGFLGMLDKAPLLLAWLVLGGGLSLVAAYDVRARIEDAQQDGAGQSRE